MESFLRS